MTRPIPTDVEVHFENGNMITETDLSGKITYVNRLFVEMSGYAKEELIGQPHSIIRHPDMPGCCFDVMWKTIQKGETWEGYVKNLRKDGAYYWMVVTVSPKYDEHGELCGFIAIRKPPGKLTLEEMKAKYAAMMAHDECRSDPSAPPPGP